MQTSDSRCPRPHLTRVGPRRLPDAAAQSRRTRSVTRDQVHQALAQGVRRCPHCRTDTAPGGTRQLTRPGRTVPPQHAEGAGARGMRAAQGPGAGEARVLIWAHLCHAAEVGQFVAARRRPWAGIMPG
ncbi:DUF6233 domain-containing protein [Streptomyces sp. AGS-58]|uniref:DUF6233 domain-containing protein n=1 Tax=unclassified Streptomyces TaxID=2593676 RepID=UPI0035A2EA78